MTRPNRIGLAMAAFISLAWLGVIVADEAWWQLVAWVIFVPIGIAAWFPSDRLSRRSQTNDESPPSV